MVWLECFMECLLQENPNDEHTEKEKTSLWGDAAESAQADPPPAGSAKRSSWMNQDYNWTIALSVFRWQGSSMP